MPSPLRAIYDDNSQLLADLRTNQEVSFANSVESILPKVLLLATASHLEPELQDLILDYFREVTDNRIQAVSFVEKKAVLRPFHTYFSWDAGNANSFFALLGNDFKSSMTSLLQKDGDLAAAVKNFVEIGSLRNQLVHRNYAAFYARKYCRGDLANVRKCTQVYRTLSRTAAGDELITAFSTWLTTTANGNLVS